MVGFASAIYALRRSGAPAYSRRMAMQGRPEGNDFEKRVDRLIAELVDVVGRHMKLGAGPDAVLEALAAVLGTTIAVTVSSVDELERSLEIASLRVQQSSDDAFIQQASARD